jgi:hypothetical protein
MKVSRCNKIQRGAYYSETLRTLNSFPSNICWPTLNLKTSFDFFVDSTNRPFSLRTSCTVSLTILLISSEDIDTDGCVCCVCCVLFGTFSFIPCWSASGLSYTCRLCGARKTKHVTRILGLPVRISRSKVQRSPLTDIYEQYIRLPHEHEWAGGAYWGTSGTLLGHHLHIDGAHAVPPFSILQPKLTRIALIAVSQVKDWPKEKRIALFHAILDVERTRCTEDYENVAKVFAEAEKGEPNEMWMKWLEKAKISKQSD